jgi:hypothetical protein
MVTTSPAGLGGVSVTYNGSTTPPTNAGSYMVTATLNNPNYAAAPVTGTLVINSATTPTPSPTTTPTTTPTPTPSPTLSPTPTLMGEMPLTSGQGRKKKITGYRLEFSAPLDAGVASGVAHYSVTQPGRTRHSAPRNVPVLSVAYNAGSPSVTLVLGKSTAGKPLTLTAQGLIGANGNSVATIVTQL